VGIDLFLRECLIIEGELVDIKVRRCRNGRLKCSGNRADDEWIDKRTGGDRNLTE